MAPKSVGLNDSPWENHSSSRERRRFCVSRAWRCSSQRTAIFILFVLLLGMSFSSVGYSRLCGVSGQKLGGSFSLFDEMIQRVGIYSFELLILFRSSSSQSSRETIRSLSV